MGLLIHSAYMRFPHFLTREGIQSATVPIMQQIKCRSSNGQSGTPVPTTKRDVPSLTRRGGVSPPV